MKKDKILINIENLLDVEEYKKIGYNNFLFAVDKFSIGYNSFDLKDLIKLNCNKYLLINRVLNNSDIEELKHIVNIIDKFDGVLFEDIGVYNILKNKTKLIWNQSHFATNFSSINYWVDYVDSAVISNELTKEEVKDIINNANKKLVLNVFGKNPAMYSRRTLLSNFNNYFKLKMNKEAVIKDKISNEEFLVKETDKGTILFDNSYFSIIDNIKEFNDENILYYLIYPAGLKVNSICDIINGKTNNYRDGFMNKKTIYKLEVKK